MYLLGLCFCRAGDLNVGLQHIKKAVVLKPELEAYDIMSGLMAQQGITNVTALLERRFLMYFQYRTIDAFLISYPKCGRTWLRLLLGKYVIGEGGEGDPLEVLSLTQASPEFISLEITHDDYPHWKPVEKLFADKRAYVDKKVIFLVRDPRDVLVSGYFQHIKREDVNLINDNFDGDLSAFIRHDLGGG